eukprot:jgi/Psemu1/63709/estExt_Genemark1.C_340084
MNYKAHVDCSKGISDRAFLAACLDTISNERKHDSTRADALLKGLHAAVFGTTDPGESVPVMAIKPQGSNKLLIACNRASSKVGEGKPGSGKQAKVSSTTEKSTEEKRSSHSRKEAKKWNSDNGKCTKSKTEPRYVSMTDEIKNDVFVLGPSMRKKWKKSREAFVTYSYQKYGTNVKASLINLEPTVFNKPKIYTGEEYNDLSPLNKRIWELDYEGYRKDKCELFSDLRKLYYVLWDQCEHFMKLKIKLDDRYQHLDETADVIELLQVIDSICNGNPSVEHSVNSSSALCIIDILRKEIGTNDESSSSSGNIVQWETLPDWVVTTTRCVFFELFKATETQLQQYQRKETNPHAVCRAERDKTADSARLHIFCVIAALMCLDSIGVRDVSCSHLPMMCLSSNSLGDNFWTELLFGMSVDPAVTVHVDDDARSASTLSTAIGISLLRVLTGAGGARRPSRIAPFTLQKRGLGADDLSNNPVSILVGLENANSSNDSGIDSPSVPQPTASVPNDSLFKTDCVAHLETNLDDMSGENLAFAIEILLQHGAMDAWIAPIVMKKGRPAHTLHCLCLDNENHDRSDDTINSLLELMFLHTSTLGVRIYRKIPRAKLDRSIVTVVIPFAKTSREGHVDVKVSRFKNGQLVRRKAEFDHCREISIETGIGIQIVADEAVKAFDNQTDES